MTTTTAQNPWGDRLMWGHFPYGTRVIESLTRVTNGDDAQKLLDSATLGADGTIVQLPSFVHIDYNGSPSPNRILYPGAATVIFVPDGEHAEIPYEIPNSLLPPITGAVRLTPRAAGGHDVLDAVPDAHAEGGFRSPIVTEVLSQSAFRSRMRSIIEDGRQARFEFAASLQSYTERAVEAAARAVFSEIVNIAPDDLNAIRPPAICESDQEHIVTELLYGAEGKQDSVILRMIDRAACTNWAVGKHVSRRMAQGIRGAAETQVRRSINDPHVGRIVRTLARELGIDDPAELLDVFRRLYPTKRVGADRIRRSLEVRDLFTSSEAVSAIRAGVTLRPDNKIPTSPRRTKRQVPSAQPTLALWEEDHREVAA